MNVKLLVLTALAGPWAMGAFAPQDASAPDSSPTMAMATTAADYAAHASASDLFEIQSSNLALERSRNSEIREFAQMMIQHHTRTTEQLKSALREASMEPPPARLMPAQQAMLDALRAAQGEAFDRLYLSQQAQAHDMALALHQTYAERGDTPALRRVAGAAVPVIEQHIRRLRMTEDR